MTTTPHKDDSKLDELKEKLAAIEHERWSDWQKYMQSLAKADWTPDGETIFTYTVDQFARWNKQIETPYSQLSRKEQLSDLEQVDRYWPLVEALIAKAVQEARKTAKQENAHDFDSIIEAFNICAENNFDLPSAARLRLVINGADARAKYSDLPVQAALQANKDKT